GIDIAEPLARVDDLSEQKEFPVGIPQHRLAMSHGETRVERQIKSSLLAGRPKRRAVVIHEEFWLFEPDRLFGAGMETPSDDINRPAMKTGIRRTEVLIMTVVIMDEEDIATAPGRVAADVEDGAWRKRMFQWFAAVFAQKWAGCGPGFAVISALRPVWISRERSHHTKKPSVRKFDDAWFLAGADVEAGRIKRRRQSVCARREPRQL